MALCHIANVSTCVATPCSCIYKCACICICSYTYNFSCLTASAITLTKSEWIPLCICVSTCKSDTVSVTIAETVSFLTYLPRICPITLPKFVSMNLWMECICSWLCICRCNSTCFNCYKCIYSYIFTRSLSKSVSRESIECICGR